MDPLARLLADPPALPVRLALAEITGTAAERGVVAVDAPPGSGKTTLVPPALAALGTGRVVVTQPRRIAARAAARRLASLLGEPIGGTVGYAVRGENRTSATTRVEMVTAGLLLRRLQADPDLPGVEAVVLDEVHERSLETDLLQAFLVEVRESLRPDLLVVPMTATPDRVALENVWGTDLATVSVDGALHPVDVRWSAPDRPLIRFDDRGMTGEYRRHVVATTRRALAETQGDVLVFLPGVADIDVVAGALAGPDAEVCRLHGRLSAAEQDRALTAGPRRRVVVSTAVAESSLTVPGVRVVVDAGLVRRPFTDRVRGLAGLRTARVSRAVADQRAGRAGREGPGVVLRCWTQAEHLALDAQASPEIDTADLTSFALEAACWSGAGVGGLRLPGAPPTRALSSAGATLRNLGALDEAGAVTGRGRSIARIPADPRLARALLDGAAAVGPDMAAEVVAMLGEDLRADNGDLAALLRSLRAGRSRDADAWRRTRDRLVRLAPRTAPPHALPALDEAVATVVALAHPDRVARLRPGGSTYLMTSGTGAVLTPGSALVGQVWLAVADAERSAGADARIRSAVPIAESAALDAAAHLLVERTEVALEGTRLRARRVRRLGAIELSSHRLPSVPDDVDTAGTLRGALTDGGLALLRWGEAATVLRSRLAFLYTVIGQPWPDTSDAALLDSLERWWPRSVSDLARIDTVAVLRTLLPWPEGAGLDDLAPERLTLPSGRSVRVDYSSGAPVVATRVQDAFGLRETPRLAGGRVPVLFHLLSPAGRPAAVTSDLAGFWDNGYRAVRSELRGRYPKHPWPERP